MRITVWLALVVLAPTVTHAQSVDASTRSPTVAGALSYVFPGVGSLYAGNAKHAKVHSSITVASWLAIGIATLDRRCADGTCPTTTKVLGIGGLAVFTVNDIWSIVTAVRDANTHNHAARAADTTITSTRPAAFEIVKGHLATGRGVGPYLDDATGGRTSELRVGFSVAAFPDWTVAWAAAAVRNRKRTSFVSPECNDAAGCRPAVSVATSALEVQRRWLTDLPIHPVATATVGTLMTSYTFTADERAGTVLGARDSTQHRQYVGAGAGLEVNAGRWIHAAAIAGYRRAHRSTIPFGTSSNSGPSVTWLLEIGRP